MNTSDPQTKRLLRALKRGPVNPLSAWAKLGIYRLGARIYDLRAQGYPISSTTKRVRNRHGEICRVAEYRLGGA